ncbi:MAG: glucosylceramidase [Bacteroidales bacterium]|nr:glucosylceramidase [Bacteroidales bacterium]
MKIKLGHIMTGLLLVCFWQTATAQNVQFWLTNTDKTVLFQRQKDLNFTNPPEDLKDTPLISVEANRTFQTVDGFGFALTGGSAWLIQQMSPAARQSLLKELFADNGNNIGTSYLRISIGSSDLNDHAYSYDDVPAGQTDPELTKFDLGQDLHTVIPVLKEILAINPKIKILGSPWSAPAWMKTNDSTRGGSLRPKYYAAYAHYFVKYIHAMKKHGIHIDAITVQNEPLYPGNNPSMLMYASQQDIFIKNYLGPAFKKAKIETKIIIYDHNADRPDYPIQILNDPEARKYIDGSAFHLYGGKIQALTDVHNAYPDKNLYFTELWVGAPGNFAKDIPFHINQLIIGAMRNWSKNVIEWNLVSSPDYTPHTQGGCNICLGGITLQGDSVTKNPGYYIIAHAAKFVRPGSVRIASNRVLGLNDVAFKTPDGKIVLIVINNGENVENFDVWFHGQIFQSSLNSKSVGTYVW